MVAIKTIPWSADPDYAAINAILEEDGCIVFSGLPSEDDIYNIRHDLDSVLDDMPMCHGPFFGYQTKRISSIATTSESSTELMTCKEILKVMDTFLLKNCSQYQINLTQAIQIFPGEPAQIIHTDDLMYPFEMATLGDQKMINCMWAIDDFTVENGATHVVPGSHKWPRDRRPEDHEIVQAVMPKGSVLIYFGSLLHGGGANKSDEPRLGLVISYCLGWLRQAENHYLALPRQDVRRMNHTMQNLLGYFVHEPNLGAVNGRDPIELLHENKAGLKAFEEFLSDDTNEVIYEMRRSGVR